MALAKTIEHRIRTLEGFEVQFLWSNGRDVRSDRSGIPEYPYERGARSGWTVATWKKRRFVQTYPGFDCHVLDGDKSPVFGQTRLSTVRGTYFER